MGMDDAAILFDALNQRIIRELVFAPLSASDIARKLNIPPVKAWRRLSELLKAGCVELNETVRHGNIEKKLYRATALKYVIPEFLSFDPENDSIREAYRLYAKIQEDIVQNIMKENDVPSSKEVGVVDLGVYADLRTFCETMLSQRTRDLLGKLEEKLRLCKECADAYGVD